MASRINTVSPFFTVSPTFTFTSVMVPGSGAVIFFPAPIAALGCVCFCGALAGAGAGAGVTTGVADLGLYATVAGLIGRFISTSKGMPFTFTLAILPSTSIISTS